MKCVLALVSVASAFVAQPRVLPARTVRAAEAPTMVTGKQVAAGLAAGIIFGGAAASQAIEVRLAAPPPDRKPRRRAKTSERARQARWISFGWGVGMNG